MEIRISAQEIEDTLNTARAGVTADAVEAFRKLGMLKCKEAAPVLIARLTDKDTRIRLVCVEESVEILGKSAAPYLAARLEDKCVQVAMEAAARLACIGSLKAAEALIRAAGSNNHIIETNGAYGLGYWTSKEGNPALLEAVLNPDYNYRGAVALALGQTGDKEVIPQLTRAFARATDEEERIHIATALTMLGDDQKEVIREGLQSSATKRKLTALACVRELMDKDAFLDIVPLLKDADANVRMDASDTLETLGITQEEKRLVSKTERAKYEIRKALPDGYKLDADEYA